MKLFEGIFWAGDEISRRLFLLDIANLRDISESISSVICRFCGGEHLGILMTRYYRRTCALGWNKTNDECGAH